MTRTRLRQLEQIRSSFSYNDTLNQGDFSGAATEGQSGDTIGASNTITYVSANSFSVAVDLTAAGANIDDEVTISGSTSASNDGTFKITSIAYNGSITTIGINGALLDLAADGSAQVNVDPNKNLLRDLDHIRTQLRKLNNSDDWFDDPKTSTLKYELVEVGATISAGTAVVLSGAETYDAGEPYTMKVYLNGNLLLPSVVTANVVTTAHDYTERDVTEPKGTDEVGDRFTFAFDLVDGDLLQFKWAKES